MKYKKEYSLYFSFLFGLIILPLIFQSFYCDATFTNPYDNDFGIKLWTLKNHPDIHYNFFHGLWIVPSIIMFIFFVDYLDSKVLFNLDVIGYIYFYIRKLYKHVSVALKRKRIE
jgi:hypothetical protein